jgi:hypothetical protein
MIFFGIKYSAGFVRQDRRFRIFPFTSTLHRTRAMVFDFPATSKFFLAAQIDAERSSPYVRGSIPEFPLPRLGTLG